MDYRPKMVLASQHKFHTSDDDEEDLDALRLAALQSLGTKDNSHNKKQPLTQLHNVVPQVTQIARPSYKPQRIPRRPHFHNRIQPRQNGIIYYQSPRNPNLIAIVPVEEHPEIQNVEVTSAAKVEKTETCTEVEETEESKFHRYKDSRSGSEEDDRKSHTNNLAPLKEESIKTGSVENENATTKQKKENELEVVDESRKQEEKEEINENDDDDDDDVLFMADSEEEDSLERLMDEMEREINVPVEKKDKESQKKNNKSSLDKNVIHEVKKNEDNGNRKESNNHATSLTINVRCEKRSASPHMTSGNSQKRRSLSPKSRSRKRSPRRSPRRSPPSLRQVKKSQRETSKYKSPVRRSPHRKLSPRIRSPRLSPHSRSPKLLRSRSPRILSRSRSPPRTNRSPRITSRSPRHTRSRSPMRLSPQSRSRSKTISPRRLSPTSKRVSPRSRSPGFSPRRGSPRRMSPPKISPRRSPWSSPRNSPRLSPRRRKSPKVSPKELPRKRGPCSISPENNLNSIYVRESPPMHKRRSPESYREKIKQKEENSEKVDSSDIKESTENTINDPILEARRKKFESTRPIDPLLANKKIKLSNNANKKTEVIERTHTTVSIKKINKLTDDDHNVRDRDLCLDTSYEFEDLEDIMENTSPMPISSSINSCIIVESSKTEKEKSSKKKKKRDKEIYQVGKLKSELPLSERIGKDKKCKKRKDISEVQTEEVDATVEDTAVDEEGDLRAELSRRRAERLNRSVPIQSARLVQSAFKGVVNDVVKNNAKVNQRHVIKNDEKGNQKDVRRVTVVRSVSELHDSGDESNHDSKVPVRFRLGLNKQVQDTRETKVSRKASKRQNRKVKHKTNLTYNNPENIL
ncbi:serine/threonine-protein kinase PRP4 homolog isoform X1 [Polistes fuscatus]|uniref:serine/threonine-protein kinase PRP4 homolog isoform X1 n=1 Tax=Polistes fuscatus TaxID=30207 RepID=UPI001CA8CFF9|nr:serine/threonine-protein kinase PRP4 homolog isoform X1 [Polistes fuscatus]